MLSPELNHLLPVSLDAEIWKIMTMKTNVSSVCMAVMVCGYPLKKAGVDTIGFPDSLLREPLDDCRDRGDQFFQFSLVLGFAKKSEIRFCV